MKKNVKKIIFLSILGAVLVYFLWSRVLSKSEEEKAWEERFQQTQQARESGETPSASPTAGGPGPSPSGESAVREDTINLDELAASIKEVEFDYDAIRKEEQMRNPMAPLVGPYVAQVPLSGRDGSGPVNETEEALAAAIRRNLHLSGIMWHPTAPIAIINNEVIPKGYTFPGEMFRTARSRAGSLENGVCVERIMQNSVILKYKDSEVTLELKER